MKSKENLILGLLGIITFLLLWELASILNWVNPLFISSPLKVSIEILSMFQTKFIYPHLSISLQEFLLGFVLAVFLGVILGLLIGWYKRLKSITGLLVFALYATPTIALLPLLIIWLGLGILTKVVIVFLSAFFPVLINTVSGVENLDVNLIRLARSFGAKDTDIFRHLALPASIPFIVAGLKLAVSRGLIGMLVAEFYVSSKGLGYLMTFYGSTFQTSKFLAVVLIVVAIGVTLTTAVNLLENRFKTWKTGA